MATQSVPRYKTPRDITLITKKTKDLTSYFLPYTSTHFSRSNRWHHLFSPEMKQSILKPEVTSSFAKIVRFRRGLFQKIHFPMYYHKPKYLHSAIISQNSASAITSDAVLVTKKLLGALVPFTFNLAPSFSTTTTATVSST